MHRGLFLLCSFFITFYFSSTGIAITLEQALELARQNLPEYRSRLYEKEASLFEYRATLSPYLPSIDLSFAERRFYVEPEDYRLRSLELRLSYILYDGGKRYSQRLSSRSLLNISEENLRESLLNLHYNVKLSFYNALARREILIQRKKQLEYAEKDYEVAKGRYDLGIARLSDVLQASVRLEEARYRLIEAEGELNKALSDLGSLIGISVNADEIEGELAEPATIPEKNMLIELAINSPELKRKEFQRDLSISERAAVRSEFLPHLFLDATYTKNSSSDSRLYPDEEKMVGLRLTFNIFELGKYFRLRARGSSISAREEDIKEVKRNVELRLSKSYEDLLTELKRLDVSREQLKFAEKNYEQALGEYRVGKGDILSLIQAESILADSMEKVVFSKLNIWIALINLERIAGIME
ncbi:MAG: TolC family protein [Thermodesulfovibrionales bacterium]|nr:TolC family protein [Thermodesulfovibrionales bacterium]